MSSDFKELLAEFNAHGVEFIVVGAHALAAHGRIRATKDLDVWIRPSPENAPRVLAAISDFGGPLFDLTEEDFAKPGIVFQIGVEPVRIDILTELMATTFDEAGPLASRLRSRGNLSPCSRGTSSYGTRRRSDGCRTSPMPSGLR
ncbi:MAG: nucleotidyltransferase [Myxococcales bacterium]|nr:nucleotidyltransferase [Myxococcales bacterium]MCA9629632.1 nucleotidyltransferase [Myxococcales bacterium]